MTNHWTRHEVMVVMRDGIRLATDVYLPTEGKPPYPVLLERTPYGKRGTNHGDRSRADPVPRPKPEIAAEFVSAGYAYVLQDVRGRHDSEGEFTKYLAEADDGVDTLEWILRQHWCNGRIGTLGLSYGAHVQSALACRAPRGLAAMFLDSGGFSSAYHSGIRQGGAYELKQLTWAYNHALLSPVTQRNPVRKAALQAQLPHEWFKQLPWQRGSSPLSAAPEYEDYVIQQWQGEIFDEFWCKAGIYARGYYEEYADVPMVHMCSWFDPYALTATENFAALTRLKRGPVRLIMGPWTHGQRSVTHAGDVDFGPAATLDGNIAPDYITLRKAWFDRHIKAVDAPDYLAAPVKYFVMGGGSGRKNAQGRMDHGGHWRDAETWPPREAKPTPFFLRQDGLLSKDAGGAAGTSSGYDFDPRNPVPTIGGAITSGAPLMFGGAFDQRTHEAIYGATAPFGPLAQRPDVLVFETVPLTENVEVTGPVSARLWVSSTAPDTDFTIKLVDVYPPNPHYPEGFAMNLTHGILRAKFRNSFERPELMVPGKVYEIEITAFPTSNLFQAGHRIRLEVSSSNFPHFDVNPNTGAPAGEVGMRLVAHNRVHFGPSTPSQVVLPIMRFSGG
jgi:putative CocE/NonD family hydrolase